LAAIFAVSTHEHKRRIFRLWWTTFNL